LRHTRQHDPAFGLELVKLTWQREPAKERAAFLNALTVGLSLADEPFLEAALDDRSKEVRQNAVPLLASLPGSQLCVRMQARVEPLLCYHPAQHPRLAALGLTRGATISMALPEMCDAAMTRDGIDPKGSQLVGERSGWLNQMLSLVPPAVWVERWGVGADKIVAAVDDEAWDVLITGWAYAAVRYKDAAWADQRVREWRSRDYQAPLLIRTSLIDAARKRDWNRLPEMLDTIAGKDRDQIFAASLIRMVTASGDTRVVPVLLAAVKDPSPLVRAAAAEALQQVSTKEAVRALVEAAGDDYRLVRVRAAASLAGHQDLPLEDARRKIVALANQEYLASLLSRPDQWSSYYNLGNYYLNRGDFDQAVASFDTALKLEPRAVLAMVNEAIAYARLGENQKAGAALRKALTVAPDNAAANFNMGLLEAEQNDLKGAETHLKAALKNDPQMAQAAYNLCVMLSKDRIEEAVGFCRQAAELRWSDLRYTYTLAFFLQQKGDSAGAAETLEGLVTRDPSYADAYLLLGEIYEKAGDRPKAVAIYNKGLAAEGMPEGYRSRMKVRLEALKFVN